MILEALLVLQLIAAAPSPSTKGPPPAVAPAPQCMSPSQVEAAVTPGTTILATFDGARAAAVSRELEGPADVTQVRVYANPSLPEFVFLTGFRDGCLIAEGVIPRAEYERIVAAI